MIVQLMKYIDTRRYWIALLLVLIVFPWSAIGEEPETKDASSAKIETELSKMTNPDAIISNSIGDRGFIAASAIQGAGEKIILIERQSREAAIKNFITGKSAVLLLNGELSAAEQRELGSNNTVQQFAVEPLLFVVNAQNTINDLSSDSLRKIFSGEVVTWKPFGVSDYMIHLFGVSKTSAAYDILSSKILKNSKISVKIFQVTTVEEAMLLTGSNRHAIGYCGFSGYIPDEIKLLSVDGVIPEEKNFLNGKYPAMNVFYICYKKDGINSAAKSFVENLFAQQKNAVVRKSGIVFIPPPAKQ